MSNLAEVGQLPAKIEQVLINGDLKALSSDERVSYYNRICSIVGLNPFTKPLEFITLNGKLVLYARKDATDQLRRLYNVSIDEVKTQRVDDLYIVTAFASIGDRKDSATGALSIKGLSGENLANAIMKAETKAKRRVTLSICGLGLLDETEVEDAIETERNETVIEAQNRFEEAPLETSSTPLNEYYVVKLQVSQIEERNRLKAANFRWDPVDKCWFSPVSLVPDIESLNVEYTVAQRP